MIVGKENLMSENKFGNIIRVNIGIISIIVLLVTQLVIFSFGYGALQQQVKFNREIIQTNQANQLDILKKLNELELRITRLETTINQSK